MEKILKEVVKVLKKQRKRGLWDEKFEKKVKNEYIPRMKNGEEIQVAVGRYPNHSYTIYNSYDKFVSVENGKLFLTKISYGDGSDSKREIDATEVISYLWDTYLHMGD